MTDTMIRWEQDEDGIVVLTMDDPTGSVNVLNAVFAASLDAAVARLEAERETVTGVILTSAKRSFFAGADLTVLRRTAPDRAAELARASDHLKGLLRRLETLGRPVVAAVNGAAIGGGLEVALACHHRIALDAAGSRIGLPEVTLGLLPGAGGLTRTVRMLGLHEALSSVVLTGRLFTPPQALAKGLVDEVAESAGDMFLRAREWIARTPGAAQPWDVEGYRIPGGAATSRTFNHSVVVPFSATVRNRGRGTKMDAPHHILAAAVEGTQVDIDTALAIETRYLAELACGQISSNMIKAFHFDTEHIANGGSRPEGFPAHRVRRAVVLGAGMMGAGIAYVCAAAGIDVVLKDIDGAAAERGKAYSRKILDRAVSRGQLTEDGRAAVLDRITPTDRAEDAAGADLVIEAVFEDAGLKKQVFAEIEPYLAPDAVLASNTSTLPITGLAEGVRRPEDFVGLHFFSPVDKMALLEIIVGEKTSDATLARAFDLARQIGKTPIVVGDSRGFFTSRVISTFLNEALSLIAEGAAPASVEQAGMQAGYPTAPLALFDELNMKLAQHVRRETQAAYAAEGRTLPHQAAYDVIDRMVEWGRPGRLEGAGFHDYADGERVRLWPGLADAFPADDPPVPFADMQERMLFAEALESVRCLDEGVLRSVPDANVGSILGIGFPAWTGGVLQYVNQYEGGPAGFVARAHELAARYGERFTPPASLVARAERGEVYE
ncbi:3-hydroxyacyl-CoA dehydrogenase NAD-binding domain-containing protein [Streptomyces angustmyceticus]|uniref:3-hydroxyacyl-CoA dehydrogenase n=2 Tax=Streptomyces angustmyceticus TaxID=285578 RepID=A0A5J4LET1_9ACTN|nr:3-hydroxyacyl-CoA dehydrogenase NAD-binding domain-containing protein [Streptomyces angustmyceticus]UAL70769.1 enoyl-CoA hydratase/isomerase family protein [Streptomyces angustmyceticus]GES29916.1 3-hydroxyacyl-CoA dehydrogenase [Streptomyces angustmyceticus]